MNLLLFGDTFMEERRRGRKRGRDGEEGNQTGWTLRAHTDALCLMSLWHFCSPSPPHQPSVTGSEWAERKRQRGGDIAFSLDFTQGHEPQTKSWVRVHWGGSQSRGGIQFHCLGVSLLGLCRSSTASGALMFSQRCKRLGKKHLHPSVMEPQIHFNMKETSDRLEDDWGASRQLTPRVLN